MTLRKSKLSNSPGPLKALAAAIRGCALRFSRSASRRLRLCESLPLGEHRFVAVVEFDGESFLVGGTSASLVLLARLGRAEFGAEAVRPTGVPDPNISEMMGHSRRRQGFEAC